MVADWTWPRLFGRTLRDVFRPLRITALEIARTIRRMLCGLSTGRQPGAAHPPNELLRGLQWQFPGRFPAAAPTFVRTLLVLREMFPGNCSDTAWKLSGDCPHDSADVARTRSGCGHGCGLTADWSWTGCGCEHRAGHLSASARTLPVHCPDAGRIIPGYCLDNSPDDSVDDTSDILPNAARTLRDLLLYLQVRGWCLTKMTAFTLQKASTDSVRLNVSRFVRGCAEDNALNGRF